MGSKLKSKSKRVKYNPFKTKTNNFNNKWIPLKKNWPLYRKKRNRKSSRQSAQICRLKSMIIKLNKMICRRESNALKPKFSAKDHSIRSLLINLPPKRQNYANMSNNLRNTKVKTLKSSMTLNELSTSKANSVPTKNYRSPNWQSPSKKRSKRPEVPAKTSDKVKLTRLLLRRNLRQIWKWWGRFARKHSNRIKCLSICSVPSKLFWLSWHMKSSSQRG